MTRIGSRVAATSVNLVPIGVGVACASACAFQFTEDVLRINLCPGERARNGGLIVGLLSVAAAYRAVSWSANGDESVRERTLASASEGLLSDVVCTVGSIVATACSAVMGSKCGCEYVCKAPFYAMLSVRCCSEHGNMRSGIVAGSLIAGAATLAVVAVPHIATCVRALWHKGPNARRALRGAPVRLLPESALDAHEAEQAPLPHGDDSYATAYYAGARDGAAHESPRATYAGPF